MVTTHCDTPKQRDSATVPIEASDALRHAAMDVSKGVQNSRVTTVVSGFHHEFKTSLWIVIETAKIGAAAITKNTPFTLDCFRLFHMRTSLVFMSRRFTRIWAVINW